MDHDALNKAYDDEVSRLFRNLCMSRGKDMKDFEEGVAAADAAYDAVNAMWRERIAGMTQLGDVRRFGQ